MKKVIIVMLLALALTFAFAFTGCGNNAGKANTPATKTEQTDMCNGTTDGAVTGGDEGQTDDNDSDDVNTRIPVTPIENGGNINKS